MAQDEKDIYLKFGKYTKDCPRSFILKTKKIKAKRVTEANVLKILRLIKDEFDDTRYYVSCTTNIYLSRFIKVDKILKIRLRSCGAMATVVAAVFRELGVPTKLISGYYKRSHPNMRHAWNEIYIEEKGKFIPFDITRKNFKLDKFHIKKDEWVDWSDFEKRYSKGR